MAAPAGSEAVGIVGECRVINTFKNHLNDFLHQFVV